MRGTIIASLAGVLMAGLTAMPALALDAEAVRERLEQSFPVEVLKLEPAELAERPVFVATVMVRPGNYNDAMRVSRVVVDAQSGELIRLHSAADAGGLLYRTQSEGIEALSGR